MSDAFEDLAGFDVFLSYSSKDIDVVRPIAERLKLDGLRVWFDEWAIKPGDNIPHKIEEGLEYSRVLVFCMSVNAFDSDWAVLESQSFRFRDPLNKERRFIPLRLDEAPIKGSLAQFQYIPWQSSAALSNYRKLLEACRSPTKRRIALKVETEGHKDRIISLGHTSTVWSVAWSGDGRRALSGSDDHTVRLWDLETGRCERVMEGPDSVRTVAWSSDGRRALSGSDDHTVRLWDLRTGRCERVMKGHTAEVNAVSWNSDGRHALSGSSDNTLRLWDLETGRCERVMEGHMGEVYAVAWNSDGRRALSGSDDCTAECVNENETQGERSGCNLIGDGFD